MDFTASNKDEVNLTDLEEYVKSKVKKTSDSIFHQKQIPQFCCSEKDLVVINKVSNLSKYPKKGFPNVINAFPTIFPNSIGKDFFTPFNDVNKNILPPILDDTTKIKYLFREFKETLNDKSPVGIKKSKAKLSDLEKTCNDCEETIYAKKLMGLTYLEIGQGMIDNYIYANDFINLIEKSDRKNIIVNNLEYSLGNIVEYFKDLKLILKNDSITQLNFKENTAFLDVYLKYLQSFEYGVNEETKDSLYDITINLINSHPSALNYFLAGEINEYLGYTNNAIDKYIQSSYLGPSWYSPNLRLLALKANTQDKYISNFAMYQDNENVISAKDLMALRKFIISSDKIQVLPADLTQSDMKFTSVIEDKYYALRNMTSTDSILLAAELNQAEKQELFINIANVIKNDMNSGDSLFLSCNYQSFTFEKKDIQNIDIYIYSSPWAVMVWQDKLLKEENFKLRKWDYKYKGNKLPAGTYFLIVRIEWLDGSIENRYTTLILFN